MYRLILHRILITLLIAGLHTTTVAANLPQRVISLGGSVTEIIFELDKGHTLIATDMSSVHPTQATVLPQVGYYRNLSLEGVLSMNADLILASEQAGPPDILRRIQDLGITVRVVDDDGSLTGLYSRIRQIANALGVQEKGEALANDLQTQVEQAAASVPSDQSTEKPVTAIVLIKRAAQAQAAGMGSTAHTLLGLAGLTNVLKDQHGYKPVSTEAMAAMQPELIVTTTSSIKAMGGKEALLADAGISLTPAAKLGQVLILDDMLILGLGPRTPQAIKALAQARNRTIAARAEQQHTAAP